MQSQWYIDWYKNAHHRQYPQDITQVWSNWTPRGSRIKGVSEVVYVGMNYFIKKHLIDTWDTEFFALPWEHIEREYKAVVSACMGDLNPDASHLHKLHKLGYLPIKIYSLPEGSLVPLRVPCAVLTNTHPEFFWLPNYLESVMSSMLWMPSTSATTARRFRQVFVRHAREAGEKDLSFVDWQGHDFSYRGMPGTEAAILSGLGHLTQFSGTDTVPAILAAHQFYRASYGVGGSVPATEHSVMSAGTQGGEFETFRRLITEVHPTGVVSIVSDTWDLWKVLTDYVPRLKREILNRPGKIVIRPDSGDPVEIMGGTGKGHAPEGRGVLALLAETLGVDAKGMIQGAAAIYGDSITVERADEILTRCRHWRGLHPYNVVLGIGSYTYQYTTRDTFGWAMKATAVRRAGGQIEPIFKQPVTDSGEKFSARGLTAVCDFAPKDDGGKRAYKLFENAQESTLDDCAFDVVYQDGELKVDPTFEEIRRRARLGLE